MVCVTVCDCDCRLTNTTQSRAGSWTTRFHNRHNTTHFTPHPRGCRRGVPAEVDPRVIGHDVTSAQATSSSESAGSAGRAVNCVSFSRGQADTLGTSPHNQEVPSPDTRHQHDGALRVDGVDAHGGLLGCGFTEQWSLCVAQQLHDHRQRIHRVRYAFMIMGTPPFQTLALLTATSTSNSTRLRSHSPHSLSLSIYPLPRFVSSDALPLTACC
jgi:hypothetical protein